MTTLNLTAARRRGDRARGFALLPLGAVGAGVLLLLALAAAAALQSAEAIPAALALGAAVAALAGAGFVARTLAVVEHEARLLRLSRRRLIARHARERRALDAARRDAESANVAKSLFLATMSHELRTPLNAILGFSEVMQKEIMGPLANPTYRDYAGSIHQSGAHLLHLINEILDLSRIEAGRYELSDDEVRLVDSVDDCRHLLRLKLAEKSIAVVEQCDDRLRPLRADERAVRQICLNLLANAVTFTPAGGRITLTVAAAPDGGQQLRVADSGPGIPASDIAWVLEPYRQGADGRRGRAGGTGLGLAIVKKLVDLHGGELRLVSEPGGGTEAIVSFPASRVALDADTLRPVDLAA